MAFVTILDTMGGWCAAHHGVCHTKGFKEDDWDEFEEDYEDNKLFKKPTDFKP